MTITQNAAVREVLLQVTRDPDYADVSKVGLFSPVQMAMVALAFSLFAAGVYGYAAGYFPLFVAISINILAVYISFTPLHDASHRALSSNKVLNDLLGTLSGQLIFPGINMPVFRAIHMDHHRYVGDRERDPDFGLVEVPKWIGLPYLAFVDIHWLHWYLTKARTRWPDSIRPYVFLLIASFLLVHLVGFLSPYAFEFLMLYVVPQRLGLWMIAYAFAHIQHPEDRTWEEQPFQSTVKITGHRLKRMLLLGQADHAMHHFLPHVPWFKYARVWRLANGVLSDKGVPERGIFTKPDMCSEPAPDPGFRTVTVTQAVNVARDVRTFVLAPRRGQDLPRFEAGAHIALRLPSGRVRQYSLLNAPDSTNRYQIAVKREADGRGGSKEVHERLTPGTEVEISAPHNNFVLYENAARYILIAGGIGLTPLLSMAQRLRTLGKPFELHVCARTPEDVPFGEMLNAPARADTPWAVGPKAQVHIDAAPGQSSIDLEPILAGPGEDTLLYVCGPGGFMDWVTSTARALGWPDAHVQTESFAAPIQPAEDDHAFTLHLERSGRTIEVGADTNVIDALRHAGITPNYACMQGTCGTCVTRVVSGAVDHRDAFLSESEKASQTAMCVCVSRAKGDTLTIDL